jgi:hypothetical protein
MDSLSTVPLLSSRSIYLYHKLKVSLMHPVAYNLIYLTKKKLNTKRIQPVVK